MYGIWGWVYGVRVNSRQSGPADGAARPCGAALAAPPVATTAATAVALPSSARLLMIPTRATLSRVFTYMNIVHECVGT